jgi:molybdenum-dependent DNA-binding transcriptional regulator ModE
MKMECPKCGLEFKVSGLGRKPLNIGLNKVLDALERQCSVKGASQELGCSPGYIFNTLKAHNLKAKEVIASLNQTECKC